MNTTFTDFQNFILIFIFILLGVVFNDYTKSLKGDDKIYIVRMVLVSLVLTPLLMGLRVQLFNLLGNMSLFYFACIIVGWANYKFYDFFDITGSGFIDFLTAKIKKYSQNDDDKETELVEKIIDIIENKDDNHN